MRIFNWERISVHFATVFFNDLPNCTTNCSLTEKINLLLQIRGFCFCYEYGNCIYSASDFFYWSFFAITVSIQAWFKKKSYLFGRLSGHFALFLFPSSFWISIEMIGTTILIESYFIQSDRLRLHIHYLCNNIVWTGDCWLSTTVNLCVESHDKR